MKVNGEHYRTIWMKNFKTIQIIDQRYLPHKFIIEDLTTSDQIATAIEDMHVRGAGLIGVTAAYGMYLAALEAPKEGFNSYILQTAKKLKATRPTAIDLKWAVEKQLDAMISEESLEEKILTSRAMAEDIEEQNLKMCRKIGEHGLDIIEKVSRIKDHNAPVNILTHCNAGWLAFVDYGSATAPIYAAFEKGIKVHVWVDETRPRNQGALTAWELSQHGVPNTYIPDNTGAHLMQRKLVDMVLTGADRITCNGDAANKIGTLLKAVAAKYFKIPFYIAIPSSSFDWNMENGMDIPIEERSVDEVKYMQGLEGENIKNVQITDSKNIINYAFDVTPANLITDIITERGICRPNKRNIFNLFPEYEK